MNQLDFWHADVDSKGVKKFVKDVKVDWNSFCGTVFLIFVKFAN